jgi:bacillolysin
MKNTLTLLLALILAIPILGQQNFKKQPKTSQLAPAAHTSSIKLPLLATDSQITDNGLPIFLHKKIANKPNTKYARGSAEAEVYGYLEALKDNLKIKNPQQEFAIINVEVEKGKNTHTRLQQMYKGIPVYGGEIITHSNGAETDMLNGRYYPSPNLPDVTPKVSANKATEIAQNHIKNQSHVASLSPAQQSLLKYSKAKTELLIYHQNEDFDSEQLAWRVELRPNFVERWQYFVNAKTGAIINNYNHTCALDGPATATARDLNNINRSIKTYQKGSAYVMIDADRPMFKGGAVNLSDPQGVIWTINGNNTTPEKLDWAQVQSANNTWNNPTAVSAHYNAGIAYDYFLKTHNRNSLNGRGGSIISIINLTEADPNTGKISQMDNAFWNGEFMGYGNGKDFFRPLAGGLDVAGHEMTHGVIENTANLNYQGQSGAINESMADCFGVLIDRQDGDFVVGEDVMKNGKPFLRSLSDPNKGDQPAHMSERYTGQEDNGGVHINSGIPNRAFYLFVTALSGNEETKKQKAEKIYYRALTKYLTRSSKFLDLRAAIVQSCKDLEAEVGAEALTAANAAFDAVGIGSSGSSTTTPNTKPVEDLPTNSGAEFILSYDPCDKDIYSSKEIIQSEADYRIVVNDVVIDHKPSVTDDGSYAYYVAKTEVGGGGTINRVNLVGTPKVEVLTDDKVWRNVAVSKDGKRLAAITIETQAGDEQYIYFFDLVSGNANRSKLYNPTYSQNVKSAGTPLYADALEWEYNGENVIYDAYNEIASLGFNAGEATNAIQYWDVGIMHGWDNASNKFADGTIVKIFTNLARNESIGNPSFAKKSTSVVAFDRLLGNQNSILTVDFESKGADGGYKRSEFNNNTIGYPEFSAKDDKLIFNREVSKQKKCNADSTNTAMVNLQTDKVTTTGQGNEDFIISSSLAVWYTVGKRELPTKATQIINMPVVPAKTEGTAFTVDLSPKTDKGIDVLYQITTQPSGIAKIENGKIVATGKPGKITITGSADGNSTVNAASNSQSFCVNPAKPVIGVTELANAILLQSSADSTNIWLKDGKELTRGVKGIQIQDQASYSLKVSIAGCESALSDAYKAGMASAQTIQPVSITDKPQGTTTAFDLPAKTDQGNPITYTVVSGPANVVGNKLSLTGQPGRVKVKGISPAGLKYAAAEIAFEFCVNPAKPVISITQAVANYVFTSSSALGNSWFRNGVAINEFGQSINVVSTNSFTVQVTVDGCKSEMSAAVNAQQEIVLAEEAWLKAGLRSYPNPVTQKLSIKWAANTVTSIAMYDMLGKQIYFTTKPSGTEHNIDMQKQSTGTYFLLIDTKNGQYGKRILKEKQ